MNLENLNSIKTSKTSNNTVKKEKSRFPPIYGGTDEQPLKESDEIKVKLQNVGGTDLKLDETYVVNKCWLSNLGDMSVWLINLSGEKVNNPYMAHHFNKV